MNIGIIGAGNIGATLARHLKALGHDISLANSRGVEGVAAIAASVGAKPVTARDAAHAGPIVIVTIPQKAITDLPPGLFDDVPADVVVVDTGNYYPEFRDGHIGAIDAGQTDSEWVSARLKRPVVKAFNNIQAGSLDTKGLPRGAPGRIALPVSGDDPRARQQILQLVDALGFDAIDAGPLSESWRQQPGTAVYCTDLDAEKLPKALAAADATKVAEVRQQNDLSVKAMFSR